MRKQNLIQIVLVGGLLIGPLMVGSRVWADDTDQLKQQVQALQNRVDQLQSELANKQQAAPVAFPLANGYFDQWEDPYIPYYLLGGPNSPMRLMQEQMDRNMQQTFADTGVFSPKMDMRQTEKQYIITMDIPGMDKDKISVETKDGMLIISGERHSEETENIKNNQYYRQERSFGSFMQSIPLPDDARQDQIEARYKNGVLTVTVPRVKKEDQNPGSQRITVK